MNAYKSCLLLSVLVGYSGMSIGEAPPALTATYVVERPQRNNNVASSFQWQLHRSASCVIASDKDSRVSEQWIRDAEGRIWYKRIFHKERRIIEYQPADLRLGGVDAQWDRIASVIDPAELQSMSLQPEPVAFAKRVASVYRGTRDGMQWEIVWLAREQLPVRIGIEGSYTLRLLKLEAGSANGAAPACIQGEMLDYETIDFADIGDRQGDPFIESLMKYEGFSYGHTH